MNWTKLSAIAEILSSIAIVTTLIYLGVQTKQNTEALHANSRDAIVDNELELLVKLVDQPDLTDLWVKSELSEHEAARLHNFWRHY